MLKLLIVEDDRDLSITIAEFFASSDYQLDFAYDGKTAVHLATQQAFDVIVLDIGLPRLDGIGVGYALRSQGIETPILALTARDDLDDKAAAFDVGVDDYLVKPFALAELAMRVKALARRGAMQQSSSVLTVADLRFDTGTLQLTRAGQEIKLNRTQQAILTLLLRASPNVLSRQDLIDHLWNGEPPGPDTLRTHIFELRKAVDRPFQHPLIHTLHGQGYAIRPPAST